MAASFGSPRWLSAFLDFPASEFDSGVRFWRDATGYALSPRRGDHGEFATLVPPDGDDYLRVQRLEDGPARVHLDVHVDDPEAASARATAAGAELVFASPHGYRTLRTPAGFVFCLVSHPSSAVPHAATWEEGQHSWVGRVCLDVPRKRYAAEVEFFRTLLGGEWQQIEQPETALRPAAEWALDLRLQPAEFASAVTSHLHVVTDDLEAEVARLQDAGARERAVRTGKAILEAPGGISLCVIAPEAAQLP